MSVTVAIPVLNGGLRLGEVLDAVRRQQLARAVQLLVCDSGSTDGSETLARARGATVLTIPRDTFSHGATRNLLMEHAEGSHVAFLTQDAVPADPGWLAELLRGFDLAPDVALTFGPYKAREGSSPRVRRELDSWFTSFAPDGRPRVDRLDATERRMGAGELLGARAFFTDANGCVAKAAWRSVPFRPIPYAEDHQLALDMLFAGHAKAYMPRAEVVHSHDYTLAGQLRRSFDEWRALREVYGYVEPANVAALRRTVIGQTREDVRHLRDTGAGGVGLFAGGATAAAHHSARFAGALLGTRADRLRPGLRRRLSLEGRAGFVPADPAPPTT